MITVMSKYVFKREWAWWCDGVSVETDTIPSDYDIRLEDILFDSEEQAKSCLAGDLYLAYEDYAYGEACLEFSKAEVLCDDSHCLYELRGQHGGRLILRLVRREIVLWDVEDSHA